jgi:hypothetical protein
MTYLDFQKIVNGWQQTLSATDSGTNPYTGAPWPSGDLPSAGAGAAEFGGLIIQPYKITKSVGPVDHYTFSQTFPAQASGQLFCLLFSFTADQESWGIDTATATPADLWKNYFDDKGGGIDSNGGGFNTILIGPDPHGFQFWVWNAQWLWYYAPPGQELNLSVPMFGEFASLVNLQIMAWCVYRADSTEMPVTVTPINYANAEGFYNPHVQTGHDIGVGPGTISMTTDGAAGVSLDFVGAGADTMLLTPLGMQSELEIPLEAPEGESFAPAVTYPPFACGDVRAGVSVYPGGGGHPYSSTATPISAPVYIGDVGQFLGITLDYSADGAGVSFHLGDIPSDVAPTIRDTITSTS